MRRVQHYLDLRPKVSWTFAEKLGVHGEEPPRQDTRSAVKNGYQTKDLFSSHKQK
jgi:hypothetical protein